MISVCMASYNGEKYIKEQIESILKQLSDKDELVISDDGSTDATLEVIQSIQDKRIKLIYNQGEHGYSRNFENALKNCTGDYIFLSDQDDVWKDDKVETILPLLEKYAFVVHDTEMADENLNVFATSQFERYKVKPGFWNTLARNRYNGCCMAFTRDFLNKALPFPKNQNLCRYDYWLPYLAEYKHISYTLYEPLILYRRHEGTALNAGEGSSRGIVEKIFSRVYCLFEVIKRAPVFH